MSRLAAVLRSGARRAGNHPWLASLTAISLVGVGGALILLLRSAAIDDGTTVTVRRGALAARLTTSGILRPVQSITYRSPLAGRETQITFLVSEGTRVNEGDLLVRLDTVFLDRELERAIQDVRQGQVELQVADIERQEGQAAIDSLSEGEAALAVEETRARLQLAEKKVARLREEQATVAPLLEKGFITREELRRTADELEQAEEDLSLARRRAEVLTERTHPRDRQRAQLQLAQKEAQLGNVRARLLETQARVALLREQVERGSIYAQRPGLVVYEEYLAASPRRKIRAGDRVTETQGILTIPDIDRMLVEVTVGEADVHRVRAGQAAAIVLEAFRDRTFTGKVTRVGTLARSSAERPFEDKRFDVIVELDQPEDSLRPEMTARVDIVLGDRSDVLLIPPNAVFERQGLQVAHVIGRFGVETRPVQLGESNDTAVEVVAGLVEGERVALTERSSTLSLEGTSASPGLKMEGNGGGTGALVPR